MIGVNAFILLNPFLLLAAAFWGTADDQEFIRIAFWAAFPFTVWMWYIVVRFFTILARQRRGL